MHTCLVVDDDAAQRTLTRLVVEGTGRFKVVGEAANGRDAIRLASDRAPDLVLLDLQMPVMGGLEALPGLLAAAPRSRIVVLSGQGHPERRDEARRAGAHGFLDKALSNDQLASGLLALDLPARA